MILTTSFYQACICLFFSHLVLITSHSIAKSLVFPNMKTNHSYTEQFTYNFALKLDYFFYTPCRSSTDLFPDYHDVHIEIPCSQTKENGNDNDDPGVEPDEEDLADHRPNNQQVGALHEDNFMRSRKVRTRTTAKSTS